MAGTIWRNPAFLRVFSASTVSIFGSLVTRTALPFAAILVLGAGPLEVAAIRACEIVGGLVVGLEQGQPDLADGGIDVRFADPAAAGQVGKRLAKAFTQSVEHGSAGTPTVVRTGGCRAEAAGDRLVRGF